MPPVLVDTHCHLDLEPLSDNVEAVLERARAAGVAHCVSIGTTLETSRLNVEYARRFPMVRAAVGVHPNETGGLTDETLSAIERLTGETRVVAVGEVGLDFYRDHATPKDQERAFRAFIRLARRARLPLLIHCRNAYDRLLDVLRQEAGGAYQGIMHCASGPPEFIQEALALGFHISFAGNVTFPNATALRELVPRVPDERLLIETDAPFLAPQVVRGQQNEPAYVAHTAAYLAQMRGLTLEALGELTTRNACRLLALTQIPPGPA